MATIIHTLSLFQPAQNSGPTNRCTMEKTWGRNDDEKDYRLFWVGTGLALVTQGPPPTLSS